MFFSLLLQLSLEKKPVILIPGMYGSLLHANFTDANLEWFCPKSGENILLWGNPLRFIKPYYKCTFGLLQESWNFSTHDINRYPNISIGPNKFGPLDDIKYNWKIGPLGVKGDFEDVIKAFIKRGYKPGFDLLAAPYDWRRAPMYLDDYYTKLKTLIETAKKNTKKNVTLISYDVGSLVMQRFLHKNVTWKWKKEFIRRTVMVAPQLSGSLRSFQDMMNNQTDRVPLLKNPWIGGALGTWPVQFATLPNFNVFGWEIWLQYPIINVSTYQLPNHFVERGFVRGAPVVGLNRTLRLLRKELDDTDVPTTVIYNSGVPTMRHIRYPNGIHRMAHFDNSEGDGEILAEGPRFICKNWKTIRCVDLKNDGWMFKHRRLLKNPYVVDLVVNASIGAAYSVRGRLNEIAPKVDVLPLIGYFYRNGPGPRKISTDL